MCCLAAIYCKNSYLVFEYERRQDISVVAPFMELQTPDTEDGTGKSGKYLNNTQIAGWNYPKSRQYILTQEGIRRDWSLSHTKGQNVGLLLNCN